MHSYTGLSTNAAHELLEKNGRNEIVSTKKESWIQKLISQFTSFIVLLLIVAGVISYFSHEVVDALFIFTIVIVNGLLGFYQEFKAEKAVEALKNLSVSNARVLRDGAESLVPSTELVVGDIVILEEGAKVPADGVLLEVAHLEVNESALTGESMGVEKQAVHDSENISAVEDVSSVFLGTVVTRGKGVFKVLTTGMQTKFGKVTVALASIQEAPTPLQVQLQKLGRYLSIGALVCCAAVFVVGFIKGFNAVTLFFTAVSLAVAAIPEGLPAIVTITLGIGVTKMAKRNAIVRKLSSIETLGSTQIICTDKTGTLTTNQMRVREIWFKDGESKRIEVEQGLQAIKNANSTVATLLTAGILCNNSNLVKDDKGADVVAGDTTEGALLYLAKDSGIDYESLRKEYEFIEEFPFDGVRKSMAVVVRKQNDEHSDFFAYIKGAPELLLERADIPKAEFIEIKREIDRMAEKGLRTLAVFKNSFSKEGIQFNTEQKKWLRNGTEITAESIEIGMQFVGLWGIADPPRSEVKLAIEQARQAGVKTMMITGDNPVTATAIGKEIGLVQQGDLVWTGSQLRDATDDEVLTEIDKIRVFARTAPEDKLRIVRLLQSKGYIVSSTGDGVNDALALKQATIGVAMGITGTDVAKEASDMVLADDNYTTIVAAIEEGRRIYRNLVKAVHYLVSTNLGEIFIILGALVLFGEKQSPLTPVQILWMNLVTDGLPALGLATDVAEPTVMKNPPRKQGEQIIDKGDWWLLFGNAVFICVVTLGVFWAGFTMGGLYVGRSWAFVTVVALQLVRVATIRKSSPFNNMRLLAILVFSLLLQIGIVSFEPTRKLFDLQP